MKLYRSLEYALKHRDEVRALKLTSSGKFPEEIFDIPNLTELYLYGEWIELPKNIELNRLKLLSLHYSRISGSIASLFSLPSLENFKLISCDLGTLTLPLGGTNPHLKSLTLKNCELTKLPEEISIFTHLKELSLPQNKLQNLPHSFLFLNSLTRLNLDFNQFMHFPEVLTKLTDLNHLSLDGNLFSEEERVNIQRKFNIWVN